MNRTKQITRKTRETDITLSVNLDGTGIGSIDTGVGFFNHMLELVKTHSYIDLNVTCKGDVDVDFHHTVEDVGIVFGAAVCEALGDRKGIERFSDRVIPMDDSVSLVAMDLDGRPALLYDVNVSGMIGAFDFELVEEFFRAVTNQLKCNLYVKTLAAGNKHHVAESIFKAFARCLKDAVAVTGTAVPSSKGVL